MAQGLVGNFDYQIATFDVSESAIVSTPINMIGKILIGVIMPAAWTAADLKFSGCLTEGGTYLPVFDEDNAEVAWAGVAASQIHLASGTAPMIGGFPFLKLRCTNPQAVDREIGVLLGVVNP